VPRRSRSFSISGRCRFQAPHVFAIPRAEESVSRILEAKRELENSGFAKDSSASRRVNPASKTTARISDAAIEPLTLLSSSGETGAPVTDTADGVLEAPESFSTDVAYPARAEPIARTMRTRVLANDPPHSLGETRSVRRWRLAVASLTLPSAIALAFVLPSSQCPTQLAGALCSTSVDHVRRMVAIRHRGGSPRR
jgi:hypothetical protein